MLKNVALFYLFILLGVTVKAQNLATIKGKIVLPNQSSSEGAVVSLFQLSSGRLLKTNIVDSTGSFTFSTGYRDSLQLSVVFTGYSRYRSAGFLAINYEKAMLPKIELTTQSGSELEAVEVVSKAQFVERKIDRTIINPDALIGNAGTNALEVLEKSPGIQVDINGNISLRGKQGVMVFVDDKPTYLAAADLANYLRSLPAGTVANIEIMTNPPAKFDAAGNAGIINIKLKRNRIKGLNGGFSTSYGQGIYARTNNSFNFNYRINKINFFSNFSYNSNTSFQDLYIERYYFQANSTLLSSVFNQNSFIKRSANGLNGKIGFDLYINKKQTLGMVLNGFGNNTLTTTTNNAQLLNGLLQLQGLINANSPSHRSLANKSINLNYTYKPNSKGTEISSNADYIVYHTITNQNLLSINNQPNGDFLSKSNLVSNLPSSIHIYTFKSDYLNPLKNGGRFEAGVKTSIINTSNMANFFDEVSTVLNINYDFSNNFNYKENINAAYVNYHFNKKKFSFQTGMRLENTNIEGLQYGNPVRNDSTFKRSYQNLFPTFFMLYRIDSTGKHQLGLSMGRRINRPDYQSMNPFTYPMDRFTLYAGNPFLQPSFSQNIELSHTYMGRITTAFEFTYAKDVISETIQQENGMFYSRPGNFGKQFSYSLSFNGNFNPTKWWSLQLYTEITHNQFKSIIYDQQLNNRGTFWFLGPTNQFIIGKKWSAEFAVTYTSSVVVGQFITIPVWTTRMGFAKKIWANKGSIKFNLNDIFYSNQPGGKIIALANSVANWRSFLDTRVASVVLSYRFTKGKSLNARNTGGSDAEKGRVK